MLNFRLVFFLFMTALIISCQVGDKNHTSSDGKDRHREPANHHEYEVRRKKLKLSSTTEVPLVEGEVSADWFVMVEDNFKKTYLIFKDSDLHNKISDEVKECLVFETDHKIGNLTVLFHADEKYKIAGPGLKEFAVPVKMAGTEGCIPQLVMRGRNRVKIDSIDSTKLLVLVNKKILDNNKEKKYYLPVFVAYHPKPDSINYHCGFIKVKNKDIISIEAFINQGKPYEVYAGFEECSISKNIAFPKKVKMLRELIIE